MAKTESELLDEFQKGHTNAKLIGKSLGKIHTLKHAIKLDFNKTYLIASLEELEIQLSKIEP